MRYLNVNDQHSTGEICPKCEQDVLLLITEAGLEFVECDCGRAGILSAA